MSGRINTFKLGLFLIIGSSLFVLMVVVLGAGSFFKRVYHLETYLNESVNGLEVGSPVKYRGVKVGTVSSIGFVADKYADFFNTKYRYVLVECEIEPRQFGNIPKEDLARALRDEIERGLRVRPISLGLTGQLYLGIDYVDPKTNPPLAISWEPQYLYIPAAPSTLSKVEEAVARLSDTLGALNKQDLEAIIGDVKAITASLSQFVKGGDKQGVGKMLARNMEELGKAIDRVNDLLGRPEFDSFISNASRAAKGVDRIVESAGDNVLAIAASMREASESIKRTSETIEKTLASPEMQASLAGFGKTLKNVNSSADDIRAAAARLHSLLGRVNALVAGQQANIEGIVEDTRGVLENLRELSGEAKRYPAGMIFGQPPAKVTPENP
ncbi:MAG TPA: mammalian cell entry protein [Desulfovibrio sp.]|nr:mammalian cell entry protein [Desulfovibrio sp.]